MTANAVLLDRAVDHAINELRFERGVVYRMIAVLNRADARLVTQLAEALLQMDAESFTVQRLDSLLVSVRETNAAAYAAVFDALEPALRDLAEAEAAAQRAQLRAAVPAAVQLRFPIAGVSVEQVYAAALSRPFQGRLLREWAAALAESRLRQVREAVRAGYVEGQTTADIIRKIRGTKALRYEDGILARPRRELATVVQTALSHTAQTARSASYAANADLIKALRWVSTLDSRTSPMCRVRDGLLYTATAPHKPVGHKVPWGEGPGRIHFNAIPAGSVIRTRSGCRLIEDVRNGDMVLTHRGRYKPVTDARSKVNEGGVVRVLCMESGRVLRATDDHPVFVNGKGWVFVGCVEVGDALFCHAEQVDEVFGAGGVVISNTKDSPSVTDERGIALSRTCELAAAGINLKGNLWSRPCEVEDVVIGAVLWDPSIIECESSLHYLFALAHMLGKYGRHALGELLARRVAHRDATHTIGSTFVESRAALGFKRSGGDLGVFARVVNSHPLGVSCVDDAVVFGEPGGPMIGAAGRDAGAESEILFGLGRLTSDGDAVDSSESGQDAIADVMGSLYRTERSAELDVFIQNQRAVIGDGFRHDRVISIEVSPYSSMVYDLAVQDDASYVCNGIVVSNCRSVSVPVLKSWKELGIDIADMPPGTRASMDGQVPADLTYRQWLSRQSAERQDEILGPERGKLLRAGKVTVEQFTDDKGNWLTLDQLRAKIGT